MGFLKQEVPVIDFEQWSKGTRAEKIRPMARHWAEVGFGTPVALPLFYVLKIGLYIAGGALFAIGHSWTDPVVFQKIVLYTMLFEVVGLGCGFGPLNNRFYPPMGSILYWLRPNTIRLPPWPNRVPLTRGDNRDPVDVVLYGALGVGGTKMKIHKAAIARIFADPAAFLDAEDLLAIGSRAGDAAAS